MAATTLGKRKRITREQLEQPSRSPSASTDGEASDGEAVHDVFRRAFEAKFGPLSVEAKKAPIEEVAEEEEEEEEEEEGDWSGISSDEEKEEAAEEEQGTIQVINHTNSRPKHERPSKAETKAFMSARPPTSSFAAHTARTQTKKKDDDDDDGPAEASHLKNDLALQRLLRDSHILSSSSPSTFSPSTSGTSTPASLSAAGALRHKSLDLHLLSMGAKTSIHAQKSMPMSHRKGITSKAQKREVRRRAEAKENGVILEKETKKRKFSGRRESGVGGPAIGKFKGGTLKLSKADVRSITGGGGGAKGKGGKKGRR